MQPIPIIPVYADTIVRHLTKVRVVLVGQASNHKRFRHAGACFEVESNKALSYQALDRAEASGRDNPPSSLPAGADPGSRDA